MFQPGKTGLKPSLFGVLLLLVACGGGGNSTPPPPTITGVTVACNPVSLQAGQTSQCTANVSGTGNYDSSVTMKASAGTISAAGIYTAPAEKAVTQVTVTATSVQDTTKSGSTTITVNPPANPTFTAIPNITLNALGQKIPSVSLSQYVAGGSSPLAFAVTTQTGPGIIACSIAGTQLVSDYGYHGGTNTVTITVTDAEQKTAQTTVNVVVTPPTVTLPVFGMDFSPYTGSQDPNQGATVDDDQLTRQIGALAPYTTAIRNFSCTNGNQDFAEIAKRFGLKVYVGVWIGTDSATNTAEMQNCISVAQTVPVDAVIVGSEALLRNDVSPGQLINYINQFRAAVPNVPITTADTYSTLENNPSVVAVSDFVFANYYPFWEGTDISKAVEYLNAEDALLRQTYAPKAVIVSETGWQSFGNVVGNAVPSPDNASFYFLDVQSWAQAEKRPVFYFEDHDEPWKGTDDGWGIWDQDLVMKPGMQQVFDGTTTPDNWTCSAIPGGSGTPTLEFTTVPPVGSSDPLKGQELHAVPGNYYIVVYIHVGAYGWWVKPYANSPLTTIGCDGTWTTNIVTGGSDASADQIAAFLIPTSYTPPSLEEAGSLPAALYTNSVANLIVKR